MSTTYTSNVGLGKPALNDRNWHTPLNADIDLLDGLSPIGALCVSLTEHPSASLNVKVSAGKYRKVDGTIGTYAGTSSQAITASTTKVLYLTNAGVLTVAASYPAADHVKLATVVAGASTITSITDDRVGAVAIANTAFAAGVSSVAMTVPSFLSVSGSPITTSGTLAVTATTGLTANSVLATPDGSTGAVSLRALTANDIPNHSTAKLTSGTLPLARGGTNVTGTPTAGQLLIGTGTGYSLATITAGTGITITNGTGTIQIDASGGSSVSTTTTSTMNDGVNIAFGTTTGTKLGTATTQKMGFYGVTPVVQPTSTTDIRQALINVGLIATGGASPLDLNGGRLTFGDMTAGSLATLTTSPTTGLQMCTNTTQQISFWGATPIGRPANASQAAVSQTQTSLTDSTGGTVSTTLASGITDSVAKNAIASIAAELALVKTDMANTQTLVNRLRTDLIAIGLIKGSA
jgi:hypothetical protein